LEPMKSILIVGVGSIGARHLRCFQGTGRARVAICEVNAALREQVAREYQVEKSFADLDSALKERFDAAVIATPAPYHVPMGIRLAEAGVHLLLEKPLSTSLNGIEDLRRTIERRQLAAAVAYVYRANPVLQAMRFAIASGRFGRPVEVVAVCGQNFPTYRPAYRDTYYRDRSTGGGAIQDALTHILNAAEWLVGPIDRLTADAAHLVLDGVEVEDTAHVLTRHGSVLGCYSLNQHQAPNETTITVVCERGTARFENHRFRWRWMTKPDEPWRDEIQEPLPRDALFVNQANAFLDVLDGRAEPLCTLDAGVQTLRVNLAALASLDGGGWQSIAR
jgi:predicted dehydrogenase